MWCSLVLQQGEREKEEGRGKKSFSFCLAKKKSSSSLSSLPTAVQLAVVETTKLATYTSPPPLNSLERSLKIFPFQNILFRLFVSVGVGVLRMRKSTSTS